MNLKTAMHFVHFAYVAQIITGKRFPVFLWAGAGVGKTQGTKQAAANLPQYVARRLQDAVANKAAIGEGPMALLKAISGKKVAYHNIRLATKPDAGDIVGLPHTVEVFPCAACIEAKAESPLRTMEELFHHVADNHKGTTLDELMLKARTQYKHAIGVETKFARPRDIPLHGPAVAFLDELNRANLAVRDACFTLLEDGRAGVHQMDMTVFVMAAGNPPTDDYQVQDFDQEKAFMQRAIHIVITPTVEEWLQYAYEVNMDTRVIQAVAENNELLGNNHTSMEFLDKLTGGPRNMEKVSDLIAAGLVEEFGQGEELAEILSGIVGAKHATLLKETMFSKERPVPASEILADFKKHATRIKEMGDAKNSRLELLMVTNYGLNHILKHRSKELTDAEAKNVGAYILALPEDVAFGLIRMLKVQEKDGHSYQHLLKVVKTEKGVMEMLRKLNDRMSEE